MAFVAPIPLCRPRSSLSHCPHHDPNERKHFRATIVAKVGVGIIGAGRIGQVHCDALSSLPNADLITIADPFASVGREVAGRFSCTYEEDWKTIIDDPRIKAVVVASPTPFHAEQVIACARADKDIFCEKPVSNDLSVVDDCLRAVEKSRSRLLVGFQRRFDPNFRKVRDVIAEGGIGQIRMFHIVSRDPAPPPREYLEKSGGIFLDMASHDFDMVRFVTGSEIESVQVTGAAFEEDAKNVGDLDTVITVLKMKNGSFGTIDNSRRCGYGYDQRIEVFGSKGSVTGENRAPNTVAVSNEQGIQGALPYSFFMDRYAEAYKGAMKAFIDTVERDSPPPVTGNDGRAAIVAGMAAAFSKKEDRRVSLSEVDALVSV